MILSRTLLTLGLLLLAAAGTVAQEGPAPDASVREVLEQEEEAARLLEEKAREDTRPAEETPLELMLALREAVQAQDWDRVGSYLDTRYLPPEVAEIDPGVLASRLVHTWSQQNLVDLSTLSDQPEGWLDDGLPSYRDQIGVVKLLEGDIPVYVQRIPGPDGVRVWRISNATVANIPLLWEKLGYHPLAVRAGEFLPRFRIFGMENWQAVGVVVAFLVAWPIAALATVPVSFLVRRLVASESGRPIRRFFRVPVRFFLFLWIARWFIDHLGLSLTARAYVESTGVDFLAAGVLLLGLITLIRDLQMRRLERLGRSQFVPLLRPFTLMVKIVVIVVLALLWANQAGYDMSTILAGLGVGSLAVALAAQKTLENVIGAVMLYTARPVNPGDLCRFGDIVGWVEEIGLRSTVIRTLDRSLLVVPNALFSSMEVENISSRDRIRFHRHLHVLVTDADSLRVLLAELRRLFLSHPRVLQESVSIRLQEIAGQSAVVRIDSRVDTTDYQDFLAVAEDLNLHMLDCVEGAGLALTAPGQYLRLDGAPEAPADAGERTAATLARWREEDRWPFPDFSEEDREALQGSLDYPSRGSPA